MRPSANHRTDAYGGSVENRTRFVEEVVAATAEAIGGDRVGIRLSPFSPANGVVVDETAPETFARAIERIAPYGLAFLHMVEGTTGGPRTLPEGASIEALRALFPGAYIANNGYDRAMAIEAVESGRADAVAFGKLALANPDLVERLRRNAPLNEADKATLLRRRRPRLHRLPDPRRGRRLTSRAAMSRPMSRTGDMAAETSAPASPVRLEMRRARSSGEGRPA